MTHRKKRKNSKKRRMFFLLVLLVLILAYAFFLSPLFKIKSVEVLKSREVSVEEIKNAFNYKNIFLFTKNKIKEDLIKKIPRIKNLEISKNIFRREIKLSIEERERAGIICKAEKCFYIDKTGIVFEDAPQTSGSLILLINDYSERDYYFGKKVLEEKTMNFISQVQEELFLEIGIKAMDFNILYFPVKELKVMTSEGWYILFDPETEAKIQILALKAALEEKIPDRPDLEYVDLRIENRIYYK